MHPDILKRLNKTLKNLEGKRHLGTEHGGKMGQKFVELFHGFPPQIFNKGNAFIF